MPPSTYGCDFLSKASIYHHSDYYFFAYPNSFYYTKPFQTQFISRYLHRIKHVNNNIVTFTLINYSGEDEVLQSTNCSSHLDKILLEDFQYSLIKMSIDKSH